MADKNANALTLITTMADDDTFIVVLDSNGEARQIKKSDAVEDFLGSNVTETDLDKLADVTSTASELNKLDGVTAVTADFNIISGGATAGVTSTEFQYLNGVTSAIQTQLNSKASTESLKFNKKGYEVEFETGGAETTKVIDADDILTALGYSPSSYYLFPSYQIELMTGTFATTATSVNKASYGSNISKKLITGSTYGIDKVNLSSLSSSTEYVVDLTLRVVAIPT
jgi:hypothetical protein